MLPTGRATWPDRLLLASGAASFAEKASERRHPLIFGYLASRLAVWGRAFPYHSFGLADGASEADDAARNGFLKGLGESLERIEL